MRKKSRLTLVFTIALCALTSHSQAAIRLAGGSPIELPRGTTSTTLSLEWLNDTGSTQTLLGGQVFDFALSSSLYTGSGVSVPTLDSTNLNVTTTPFIDLGITSPLAPLGTLAANNFVGFSVSAGDSIEFGTLDVTIPPDFLGEFTVESRTGDLVVSLGPFGTLLSQGTSADGTVMVGSEVDPLDNNSDGTVDAGDLAFACDLGNLEPLLETLGLAPGDADGADGVDFRDFATMAANFGAEDAPFTEGDFDCSGKVDFRDFAILATNFGRGRAAAAVPEPTSMRLAAWCFVIAALVRRRSRLR